LHSTCRREARPSGEVLVVSDLRPEAGGSEDRGNTLALDVGVLDAEHSPGLEQRRRPHGEDADRVEAVVAGEERQVRVMVACLRRHGLPGLERDVRRVAHHDVDRAEEVVERRRQVALAEVDAGAGEVSLRPGVRRRVELAGMDLRPGHLVGERLGDDATSGAEVDDDRAVSRVLDGPAGQQLGFGPGREDAGADLDRDVAEPGGAEEVLERLAGSATQDQLVEIGQLLLSQRRSQRKVRAAGTEHVCQQLGCVKIRAGHACLLESFDPRGKGDERQIGGLLSQGHQPSSAARRPAMSASTHESRTGWRSPSSTWSRL
jgi:hypothetical protein